MSKRRRFIIASLLITGLYILVEMVPFSWRYQAILGLAIFSWLVFLFLFRQLAKNRHNRFASTLLPIGFIVGASLFHFFFFQGLFWKIILSTTFFLGLYSIFLAENVFLVSAEFKTVPLYRAASTIGFIITLTSAFFLFNAILSFRFPSWVNGIAVFGVVLFLLSHFLWTATLSSPFKGNNLRLILTLSLIIGEMSVVLSFWPVGVGRGSLYLVSLFYVFGGIVQAHVRQRLFKKTLWEFIWVGLGTFLALFLATSWRKSF